jgi:hypothetical protein
MTDVCSLLKPNGGVFGKRIAVYIAVAMPLLALQTGIAITGLLLEAQDQLPAATRVPCLAIKLAGTEAVKSVR